MKLCKSTVTGSPVSTFAKTASVVHSGGAAQAIVDLNAVFFIKKVVVKCTEAGNACSVSLGWVGSVDALVTTHDWPQALGEVAVFVNPAAEQAASKSVIATLTGAKTAGEWDIWVVADEYT
jgi:hypothetical protein